MKNLSILSIAIIASIAIIPPASADIFDAKVYCRVAGIRTGQLTLRDRPNGKTLVGLNNGNRVQAFGGTPEQGVPWYQVKVLRGSNARANGKEGYVNANYLTCDWYSFEGKFIRRDTAKAP